MTHQNEAGRSTGTVKRKGSLAKMTNFGYYLDDDKAFIARCEEAMASAEVSADLAEKIQAAKEALEKEMAIEPADMRGALSRLHSPLAKDDAEKEKIFKDSRSAVFLVRKAIYDEKLSGMVNTLTSKYASNAKRILEDGAHTIEVTKAEMEKYGITGDDVTAGLYSATTLSQSVKSKAVAEFIVKMRPQLEKAIDAVKAADAIMSSDLNAILVEMKNMFDAAQKDAEEIKYSVRTTIAAADKDDINAIPQPDTLGESVQNEGIFSKLASWFSKVASKIRGFVDGILGLADEANDEVDHLMGLLEEVEESVSREPSKTESKGIEQVRKELNDIEDLWIGNDYGDDKERALADACTAVEGTEWEDAACSILKDSDLMERLTVAEAIELILSELPEA